MTSFFRWLVSPLRAIRDMFPFGHEGRQTLIYLVFAGAGPALTLIGISILNRTEGKHWSIFAEMSRTFGWSLFVIVSSLGLFVAIRSFKIGPTGAEFNAKDAPPDDAVIAAKAVESDVREAAADAVAQVVEAQGATPDEPARDDAAIPDYAKP